jgi:hypothetical protein
VVNPNTDPGFNASMNIPSTIFTSVAVPANTYIQLTPYNGFDCVNKSCVVDKVGDTTGITFANNTDAAGRISITGTPTVSGTKTITVIVNGVSAPSISFDVKFLGNSDGTN